jgi:hypothetical protein
MTKHQKTENLKSVKTETQHALAPETLAQLDPDIAALAAEASELSDDVRVGDDLRFTKGKWHKIVGKKDVTVSATTSFAVDMRSYKRGWIKWIDKKPVFKGIGRPIDGFISPKRNQLPDRDKSKWPTDAKGTPQDPWQETFYVTWPAVYVDRDVVLRLEGSWRIAEGLHPRGEGPPRLNAGIAVVVGDERDNRLRRRRSASAYRRGLERLRS